MIGQVLRLTGRVAPVWVCWLLLMFAGGCSQSGPAESRVKDSGEPFTIVCTTGMVADIVRQVAGPHAHVVQMMNQGVDPHLYVPTRSDITRLKDADVIFYNGLLLEGQMQGTLQSLSGSGKPVHAVTADFSESDLRTPPEFEGHPDPHVWNDVVLWSRAVDTVAARLADFDPDHADDYRQRAAAYRQELQSLDEYARTAMASIPESQRYLVTAHDAFGYFSRAYGIPVESVEGITTESEPGVDDINRLVDLLVSQRVPAIFVESSVNSANLKAAIQGAASRGWQVKTGGTLFSDEMGAAGTY
ncbi:MAG: zinc ABC transporter substrate-binding protein, partial [Planctomycetaceae bacterium]|nr:zinc ABC transporter substrate-binding protein [Planctomycetaceae bacterium]